MDIYDDMVPVVRLRDEIAIAAMRELMRASLQRVFPRTGGIKAEMNGMDAELAERAYKIADWMISEREPGVQDLLRDEKRKSGE